VTERALLQAIIGPLFPNRGFLDEIPEPYRTTVMQSRALMKAKGSQPVEPGEVVTPPITEEPT
jgi:hypothetical protein